MGFEPTSPIGWGLYYLQSITNLVYPIVVVVILALAFLELKKLSAHFLGAPAQEEPEPAAFKTAEVGETTVSEAVAAALAEPGTGTTDVRETRVKKVRVRRSSPRKVAEDVVEAADKKAAAAAAVAPAPRAPRTARTAKVLRPPATTVNPGVVAGSDGLSTVTKRRRTRVTKVIDDLASASEGVVAGLSAQTARPIQTERPAEAERPIPTERPTEPELLDEDEEGIE